MAENTTIERIPLDQVHPHPDNIREKIDGNVLKQLVASVESSGILNPLLVRPIIEDDGANGGFQIVAGHRRHAAAEKVGLETVPCIVNPTMSDDEAYEAMLIENLQRVDLTPVEEARGYFRLVERGMTQRELASRIGRSQKHVSARLKILSLPDRLVAAVETGDLPLSDVDDWVKAVEDPIVEEIDPDDFDSMLEDAVGGFAGARRLQSLIKDSLVRRKQDQVRDKVAELCEAKGFAYVEFERDQYGYTKLPRGHATLESLKIDPKDHRPLDCHGIAVKATRDGADKVEVCTKRSKHTSKNAPDGAVRPADWEQQQERKAEEQARKEADRERRREMLSVLGDAIDDANTTQVADLLAEMVIEGGYHNGETLKAAAAALRVNARDENGDVVDSKISVEDWRRGIWHYAAQSAAAKRRAAVALSVATIAEGMTAELIEDDEGSYWSPTRVHVGQFMRSHWRLRQEDEQQGADEES